VVREDQADVVGLAVIYLKRLLRDLRIAIDAGRAEFHRRRWISKRNASLNTDF
jgi:hypothetical protein